jgi:hypothetical protein
MELANKKFKTTSIKGRSYVEVKERIQYLSTDFDGDYSIQTEYQYFPERKMWVVKATLSLVQGLSTATYTGLAQEIETGSGVNSTSALENAETSAVGRACAMAGIGIIDSIASVDEITKANNRSNSWTDENLGNKVEQHVQNTQNTQNTQNAPAKSSKASEKQKELLLKLLNNSYITKDEKNKMLLKINDMDTKRASEAIEKLKSTIDERKLAAIDAGEEVGNVDAFRGKDKTPVNA